MAIRTMPDEPNGPNLTNPDPNPSPTLEQEGVLENCWNIPPPFLLCLCLLVTYQEGVIEYSWDMLFLTVFVQLGTGLLSDWLWLVYTIPPAVGLYYLWVKVIYPWISKPDEEPNVGQEPKMKMKKGR